MGCALRAIPRCFALRNPLKGARVPLLKRHVLLDNGSGCAAQLDDGKVLSVAIRGSRAMDSYRSLEQIA